LKKAILTFILSLSALVLFAQTQTTIYHVYLKDGSFLKGYLKSEKGADPLLLVSLAGQEFRISQSSIDHIGEISTNQKVLKNGKTLTADGLYMTLLFGIMPGRNSDSFQDNIIIGANLINFSMGYQFNQQISVGGGVGWDEYDMSIFSLHADFRGFLNSKSVSPYYSLQAGYGIAADLTDNWGDRIELKGGPLLHPAVGIRFATRHKANFLLDVGYRFQWAERNNESRQHVDKIIFRRFDLRFGWKF
jgi:hypothetical protein